MSTPDTLEDLSSQELHDLAVHRAKRHLDLRFFWHLAQYLPLAEAGAGNWKGAEADMQMLRAHVDDISEAGRGEVAELMRPFYLEYLREHGIHSA